MFMARNNMHHDERYNNIVVGEEGFELQTESYNRLKDNLLYLNIDGKAKVIQFLSSLASEGKTITTTNLAVSLAMSNQKVLLIDGDLRSPRAHRTLKCGNEIGISDYLLDNLPLESIIQHTSYNVDLISRGKKIENPSAVVSSKKFKDIVPQLRDKYDYILIDCPPVLEISDYIQISTVTDGAIFCVAYGATKKNAVKEANGGTAPAQYNSAEGYKAIAAACAGLKVSGNTFIIGTNSKQMIGFIDNAIEEISNRVTKIGAAQNRVDSAISSIDVQSQNIVSSLSTLRDTDVADESSKYTVNDRRKDITLTPINY